MPYKLPLNTIADKNLIASDKTFLVCLEIDVRNVSTNTIDETLYLVHNTEDVVHNGNTYSAYAFNMSMTAEKGAQPTVTVSIDDISKDIQSRMQAYGGGVGFYVRIIVLNELDLAEEPEIIERFEVTGASTQDYRVTWILGSQNLLSRKFPNRRQLRDRCSWQFKDSNCQYSGGDATCDYTLDGPNGCAGKNNTLQFGGFPGIRSSGLRYA